MSSCNSRKYFLYLLRVIACFLVIVNHTNSDIFLSRTPEGLTWFASLTYFFVAKIAVPIFFMISGYLLLNKKDTWRKTFERILRIVIVLLFCAIVYAIYHAFVNYPNTSLIYVIKEIAAVYFISPTGALWYLYTYLGILLMLPFLQKIASLMDKKDYHIFFVISGLFFGIFPILNHYCKYLTFNSDFQLPLFSGYICMMFIGQYFARFDIKRSKPRFYSAVLLFIIMVAFNVIATYFEYSKSSSDYLFFDNRTFFPIVVESICVFYIASYLHCNKKIAGVLSYVGTCTFGIYLFSDMLIDLAAPLYTSLCTFIHPLFAVILYEIVVFSAGFVITAALRKIPSARKIL